MRAHDRVLGDVLGSSSSPPPSRMRSSRVFDTSASAELLTARRPLEQRVASPARARRTRRTCWRTSCRRRTAGPRARQHRRHRRALEVHGVAVPDAAEVHRLVRELGDRDDLGVARRCPARTGTRPARRCRRANARNCSGSSVLVAEEHDEVLEPGPPDLARPSRRSRSRARSTPLISAPSAPAIGCDRDRAERLARVDAHVPSLCRRASARNCRRRSTLRILPDAVRGKSATMRSSSGHFWPGQADPLERRR